MTTYYVSSEIGKNDNAGTSENAPLATLQAAANRVKPGDTVEVMNGTYTGPAGGDVLDITTSGTASAPITFEAAPGQTPVINSSGSWNAINIEASYIVVDGFTVEGDAANYTLQTALAGYSSGNPNLDGNGIVVNPPSGGVVPNHIIIENNTVYDEPGGGIGTEGADYVQILNNVVYDNAHWSAFGNSGISVSTSTNSDTNAGVHDLISGNIVFGNAQLVPTTGGNTITDGEGIILDTNPGYVGEILVENNKVYRNGSSGIELFLTNNAVITGNTVLGNNTEKVQAASDAEILINQSNNNTVTNNTTTGPIRDEVRNAVVADIVRSYIKNEVHNAVVADIERNYIKTEVRNAVVADIERSYIKTEVRNAVVADIERSYIKTEVRNAVVADIERSYIKTEVRNAVVADIERSYIKTEVRNAVVADIERSYIKTEVHNEARNAIVAAPLEHVSIEVNRRDSQVLLDGRVSRH